uniref:Uncharacterized protein n=1 Tax=Arundo donax TaxID=35708 RepID=A0A0A9H4M4_ARUDO
MACSFNKLVVWNEQLV